MASPFEKYKEDIERLAEAGRKLTMSLQRETYPDHKSQMSEQEIKELPVVSAKYQQWYSEALALLHQILPERVEDFQAYYAPKSNRKVIDHSNYTMTDYLRGITRTNSFTDEVIVDRSSALQPMYQQFNIIDGLRGRFKSTLYDIKTLVHADLLDDELHAAEELNKKGFQRGAGAVAGVVLESHLASVRDRHSITPKKKDPTIADLNEALKAASVIDIPEWRFIQHLGDLRNKCDHKKSADPTKAEVTELIEGVRKITKTVL